MRNEHQGRGFRFVYPLPSIQTIVGTSLVPLLLAIGVRAGWWDIPQHVLLGLWVLSVLVGPEVARAYRRITGGIPDAPRSPSAGWLEHVPTDPHAGEQQE